jgi:4-hydroxymandelate oxidase
MTMPVLIAPSAFHGLATPLAERATAAAAARAGVVYVMSTMANTRMEDVAAATTGPRWFQLYVFKDRGITRSLVERAEASGFTALELTVDTPKVGRREADERNGFSLPEGLEALNLKASHLSEVKGGGEGSGLAAYFANLIDDNLTWADVEWLRSITKLPILIKGIGRGDDAQQAIAAGAAAIIVSNHGGRQLDTARPTIQALPEVVRAVAGRVPVVCDGGIRRGTDIIKALALGAAAVQIGRPVLWGLAVAGEEGAGQVLELLRAEFELAMKLCGCRTLADITGDLIG